jgi:hypothetical protein
MENAIFFSIVAPMARQETWFTKKLSKYEEDPCEEQVYLLVIKRTYATFINEYISD